MQHRHKSFRRKVTVLLKAAYTAIRVIHSECVTVRWWHRVATSQCTLKRHSPGFACHSRRNQKLSKMANLKNWNASKCALCGARSQLQEYSRNEESGLLFASKTASILEKRFSPQFQPELLSQNSSAMITDGSDGEIADYPTALHASVSDRRLSAPSLSRDMQWYS